MTAAEVRAEILPEPADPAPEQGVGEDVVTLDQVGRRLGAAPHDRDPLLWAAHETVRCARLLLEARAAVPDRESELLAEAAAQVRSATASVHYALRERARPGAAAS